MSDTQIAKEAVPELSLEDFPKNSKEELLKKKLILGGVMLFVMLVCTLIANGAKIG